MDKILYYLIGNEKIYILNLKSIENYITNCQMKMTIMLICPNLNNMRFMKSHLLQVQVQVQVQRVSDRPYADFE